MSRTNAISTQSRTFLFTQMRVVPVAGRESMRLKLSGVHGPCLTRNIVIPAESTGNTGLGKVPAGEALCKTPEDPSQLVAGQSTGNDPGDVHPGGCRDARQDAGIVTHGIWQRRPASGQGVLVNRRRHGPVPTAAGIAWRSIWRRARLGTKLRWQGAGHAKSQLRCSMSSPAGSSTAGSSTTSGRAQSADSRVF